MIKSTSSPVWLGLVGGALLSAAVGFSTAKAGPNRSDIMPLADVKAGMKGYGLTVFAGTKPEKFDVEILGVLKGFRPNQDLILIKTPNHPRLDAARTVAGMSGSPIYLEGKMIGAYAYGWTFGAEPIAGVTPIQSMIDDLDKPIPPLFKPRENFFPKSKDAGKTGKVVSPSPRMLSGLFDASSSAPLTQYDLEVHAKQLGARSAKERGLGTTSTVAAAATPMMMGGMTPGAMKVAEQLLSPMGLEPVQAGGSGSTVAADAPTGFVDGGAIGVQLIRGDISMMGLGTVTRVEGDKLIAFGHPMQGGGASDLPTAVAKVHWILASTNRSFKIGEAVRPVGTLVNDRQASIVVDSKRMPSTFPVSVLIEGVEGATKTKWDSVCAHDPFMAPFLAAFALGNPIETTTPEHGDMTWRATTKLKIAGYGDITLKDFGATSGDPIGADAFIRSRVTRALGALLNNPWEDVRIDGVESTVKVTFAREVAMIRGTQALDLEVDPGEPVKIQLELMPFMGKAEKKVIEVPIPSNLDGEEVEIEIAPGYEIERPRAAPESVTDLIAALSDPTYPEESLVATVRIKGQGGASFRGNVATRLPPGALDQLKTSATSIGPDTFGAVQQTSHPMKRFIVGRDRVRVKVRPNLK
ncbi:MAG: hypothetical protein IPG04_34890 [Polyangiaceae bacterium]|jgi:hypothetical protein|nr:hypothetical protein [Polyangiaceae bacterium]